MNEKANSLRTIFNEAIEITDDAARAAYLERRCGEDASLRQHLERLIEAHAVAERDAQDAAALSPELEEQLARLKPEESGQRIGNYKLMEQIGEGGFGTVWVAEQEKPVRRRVALKIIKLGMDTKEVIVRFEQERQALAMMDHPNIARVFDAGATEHGRPFFVMELVRGIKITDYCDQANLSTADRLGLFIQVCHAVQHAHQKGIIHRDLKPSNILVTLHDGVPVPKVIDFGVAKATQGRLVEQTLYTQFQQMIGTPLYMSPEQAEMSGLDVDTRTDIYALGVLLYELLTGRPPFDADALMKAGYDEMRRIIREQEPQKPSTALHTMAREKLTAVAQHRASEPPKLIHAISGDLDWIVMKALEKDRTRRYETANGLAMDIQRHLDNEPVVACPPTALYRFQKLVRRNKLAFAAASAVVISLMVGLSLSMISLLRAVKAEKEQNKLRHEAETEAARSAHVAQFMKDMLSGVGPGVARGRDTALLREILNQTAERLNKDLAGQPDVEAELCDTLGAVYRDLGEYPGALSMHRRAVAIRRNIHGNEHPDVALSLCFLGQVLHRQGEFAQAEATYREALAIQRKSRPAGHLEVAATLLHLGSLLRRTGKMAEAESLLREALAIRKSHYGESHPDIAEVYSNLGLLLKMQPGKMAEAEQAFRDALAMRKTLLGEDHFSVAETLGELGRTVEAPNRLSEAETHYREALALRKKLFGNEHPLVLDSLKRLIGVLTQQKKDSEAEVVLREILALQTTLLGREHPDAIQLRLNLGELLLRLGKRDEAMTGFVEVLNSLEKVAASETGVAITQRQKLAVAYGDYAALLQSERRLEEAEAACRRAIEIYETILSDSEIVQGTRRGSLPFYRLSELYIALSDALVSEGRLADAEKNYERMGEFLASCAAKFPAVTAYQHELGRKHNHLGLLRVRQGQYREAEAEIRQASAVYVKLEQAELGAGSEHFRRRELALSERNLAFVLQNMKRTTEEEQALRQAILLCEELLTARPTDDVCAGWLAQDYAHLASLLRATERGKQADEELARAAALWKKVVEDQRKSPGTEHLNLAKLLYELGDVLRNSGQWTESETALREAVAIRRKLFGNEDLNLGHSIHNLAWVLHQNGKRDEAETLSREELAMRRKLLGNEHPDVAATLQDLSNFLRAPGKMAEAESTAREALAIRRKALGNEHLEIGHSIHCLAWVLNQNGKRAEAEALSREELAMRRKLLGNEHPEVAITLEDLTVCLRDQGKLLEAESTAREALRIQRKLFGNDHRAVNGALGNLAGVLQDQGKLAEAETVWREELAMEKKLSGKEHPFVANSLERLAGVLRAQDKLIEAVPVIREALGIRRKLPASDDPALAATLTELTAVLLAQEQYVEAESLARECLAIREKKLPGDWRTFNARARLGGALLGQKKYAEAEPLLLAGYEGMKQREEKIPAAGKPRLRETLQSLVQLYEATSRPEQAAEWTRKLADFDNDGPSKP